MGAFLKKSLLRAGGRGRRTMLPCLRASLAFGVVLGCAAAVAQDGRWQEYRSERFGYSLIFPSGLFHLRVEGSGGQDAEFVSEDGRAMLKVFAAQNDENVTPAEYRASILREGSPDTRLLYGPHGATWFVLSGVRGGGIYYQKVMFSCDGRVISAFAMTYPTEMKRAYDPLVTRIEKNFRPASGRECENR